MVFYRPHETWTTRADWRTHLPAGEEVTCEKILIVATAQVLTNHSNILERLIHCSHNLH